MYWNMRRIRILRAVHVYVDSRYSYTIKVSTVYCTFYTFTANTIFTLLFTV